MPARTLAQAIDHLVNTATVFERPAGAVLTPLLDAALEVGEARRKLDGLEEADATLDIRTKAYERALELEQRTALPGGFLNDLGRSARALTIAQFLAPAWAALEDPLGPTEGLADAEASQAGAEALADERLDRINELEADLNTVRTDLAKALDNHGPITLLAAERAERINELEKELEKLRTKRDSDVMLALWGENLGRMRAEDVEGATDIIQRRLNENGATAQVADNARREAEAILAGTRADLETALNRIRELAPRNEELERVLAQTNDERRAEALTRVNELEILAEERARDRDQAYAKVAELTDLDTRRRADSTAYTTALETELQEAKAEAARWQNSAHTLNPLFGGPHINDELEDLDTLNAAGVGLRGDSIDFVIWGRALEREPALVMAAHVVALADRGDGLFAAIYRKVINA